MRDRELLIKLRVGIFVLVLLLLFIAFVLTIGSRTRIFEEQYMLRAAFHDVQGLTVGAPVRLAGLNVGAVQRVAFGADPADPRVQVMVSIDRAFQPRIREDSQATIGTIGLVGDKVFEVTVGGDEARILQPGDFLETREPVDFGRLVAKGGEVLEGLAGASQSLQNVFKKIEEGRGLLPALMSEEAGGELVRDLAGTAKNLRTLSERAKEGEGLFGALLTDPEGTQILRNMQSVAANLKQITDELVEGKGTLGALLQDPTVYEDLSSLLRGAERSWILRGLIRSSVRGGQDKVDKEQQ
jgi:phospholipid/cholesterol/gamma-HCH transport system substrate-binding protein